MNWEERCMRVCASALTLSVVLRLWSGGTLAPVGRVLASEEATAFFVYLQTGRVPSPVQEAPPAAQLSFAAETLPLRAAFSGADAALISLSDNCGQNPDVEQLLTAPLNLDLKGEEPTVLILHSHTTESFTQTADRYTQTSPYRTLDPSHNMLALGEIVADILEEAGIGVIHDTAFHDYPSYNDSYDHAAASTKALLEQYPSIRLVLDLHRDAAESDSGQLVTKCSIGGETAAQLMFVLGTDTRLNHPDWERNLSLACKLQVLLEQENPGICRKMNLSKNRYNQHLGDLALLVEIGAAGNTLDQAKTAARALGEAIVRLATT